MTLPAAVTQAVAALRELARLAQAAEHKAASAPVDPDSFRKARALRNLAHRCAGQIQLHEDRT